MSSFKVLFVCTGNTCRSPMAAAGLRALLKSREIDGIEALSAGTAAAPGWPATQYAAEAVKTWQGDLSGHLSRPLTSDLIDEVDLILVMTPSHLRDVFSMVPESKEKTYLLKKFPEPGDDGDGVEDPIGGSLDQYNQTFLEIGEELGRILPEIIELAERKRSSSS
jgi:protein-tyrosine-phosphatase